MNVDFAFLCDHAEASNKVHALGIGIDTLYLQKVPGMHPGFFAVLQLRFAGTEEGTKSIVVRVLDPDGEDLVGRIEGQISVNPPQQPGAEQAGRFIFGFKPLPLRKYGPHAVCWIVQGTEVACVRFRVAPPPQTASS